MHNLDLHDELNPDEYQVLRAVILSRFEGLNVAWLVIADHTENWWIFGSASEFKDRIAKKWPDLAPETSTELLERNERKHPLSESFDLP